MIAALCLVFLLSGAAALIFETLWFRQCGNALGNTVWASALVTASFMAGLAIGNASVERDGSDAAAARGRAVRPRRQLRTRARAPLRLEHARRVRGNARERPRAHR